MNRRTFLSALIVGASTLSGCVSLLSSSHNDRPLPEVPSGAWRQYGGNGQNTFTTDVAAPSKGNLAWTSDAYTIWQPVFADGTVYTTNFDPSNDGSAIAIDAQDGTEQWRTTLNASGGHGRVFIDDTFIVGYGSELVALDSATGERVWTTTTKGVNSADQLVADEGTGTLLVYSISGIEAFRATDGEKRWENTTLYGAGDAPAVNDGTVFATGSINDAPFLVALSLEDGSERWRTQLSTHPEYASPVVIEDGVIVDAGDQTLAIYDSETGDRRRQLDVLDEDVGYPLENVAADNGTVFVTGGFGAVALDSKTGTGHWHIDSSVSLQSPCVGNESIVLVLKGPDYAPDKDTISTFNRETGELRWYYAFDVGFDQLVTSTPIVTDEAVFFTATHIDGLGALGEVPAQDN